MKIGRSILQQYNGLTERKHSYVFKELNRTFIVLEFFLAPMLPITPQDVHNNVYYEIHKAGTHLEHPDDLSATKTLQDSYRRLSDYNPLDFSTMGERLEKVRLWAIGSQLPRFYEAKLQR